jgi:hypothetical protein
MSVCPMCLTVQRSFPKKWQVLKMSHEKKYVAFGETIPGKLLSSLLHARNPNQANLYTHFSNPSQMHWDDDYAILIYIVTNMVIC